MIALGEFLLGYPNEYGRYTERPLIDPSARSARARPAAGGGRAQPARPRAQRQLPGVPAAPSGRPRLLAVPRPAGERRCPRSAGAWPRPWSAAPGRASRWCRSPTTRSKASGRRSRTSPRNHFTYAADPDGQRCPFGAHVRRANPRTGDLPAGTQEPGRAPAAHARLQAQLVPRRPDRPGALPSPAAARARVRQAALARGRAQSTGRRTRSAGCISSAWSRTSRASSSSCRTPGSQSTKFAGLSDESDPLLGSRAPLAGRARDRRLLACPARTGRRAASPACRSSSRSGRRLFLPARACARCATSRARPRPRRSPRPAAGADARALASRCC